MATRQQAARDFVKTWEAKDGKEDAERQTFWNDLLQRIYGINNYYDYITYEKDVQVKADGKVTTRKIDGYISSTKVMIEMKGKKVKDLSKPLIQSGGDELTPFEQAKRYANFLPAIEYPRWIIVSNFNEIDIHDMNHPLAEPTVIELADLPNKFKTLEFIIDAHQQQIIDEKKLSVAAGNLVAKIYDGLSDAYAKAADLHNEQIQQSLNMLIVRLIFLMYADDTGILGSENMFQKFLERRSFEDIRQGLRDLFEVLDTKEEARDPFLSDEYKKFSYVNGGMFSNENIIIPQFTPELKELIVNECEKGFNWSNISPTIFGAVFESTLNPEKRRSGGMHYTSIENIHKTIDPLFLDNLRDQFDHIQNMGNRNQRIEAAREFQNRLGKMKFLDPACGSGNFLTETYLSLRKMENLLLQIIYGNDPILGTDEVVKIKIQNFYGIEINDFAVSVARTAMWIAENQKLEETKDTVYYNKDFLPLDSNDSLYEGNALRMDWSEIVKPYDIDYIIGNPPFVGAMYSTKEQKADLKEVFGKTVKNLGEIDYVSGWYKKSVDYMQGSSIKCALVSTNSITQGQQVSLIWPSLISEGLQINFAYKTFVWDNEASNKAGVHCVIIGFDVSNSKQDKYIYKNNIPTKVHKINPYLNDADDIFVYSRTKPLTDIPEIRFGSMPRDGGNFIFSTDERKAAIKAEPPIAKYIKPYLGASEFLHGKDRYCLWLVHANPSDVAHSKIIKNRIEKVRTFRKNSKAKETRKLAKKPSLFAQIAQPDNNYIAVPKTSSQRREYIPLGFLEKGTIASDLLFLIPNADLFHFGILSSSVHNGWMREVAGRLKSDYRYSKKIVYNNFPWPTVNEKQKQKISDTAQAILDSRKLYPDSSLSDLYDPLTMPPKLRKAHENNDKAVLKAYGLTPSASESEIVKKLFKLYEKMSQSK